jgi:hypothetical protein
MTGREFKGRLMGHDIYRATDFDLLPLGQNINVYNPPHPVEAHLLALVRSHLHGGFFLFSYGWDLTRRLQAQWETREKDSDRPFWETVRLIPSCRNISRSYTQQADDRFFWNKLAFIYFLGTLPHGTKIFADTIDRVNHGKHQSRCELQTTLLILVLKFSSS